MFILEHTVLLFRYRFFVFMHSGIAWPGWTGRELFASQKNGRGGEFKAVTFVLF